VSCALEGSSRVQLENELARCIGDVCPVTPRRHGADGLALHQPAWIAVVELLKQRREQLGAKNALTGHPCGPGGVEPGDGAAAARLPLTTPVPAGRPLPVPGYLPARRSTPSLG
jgi:hypothetical protein